MKNESYRLVDRPYAVQSDHRRTSTFPRGWRERHARVADYLGSCRPLNLIVAACAMIEVAAIAAHLVTGR